MWRIKYWFRKHIKYPLQRMSRGYADEDLFNINWWFLTTVGKMLCELSKCNCAYPGTDKYPTNESWQADLEKYGKLALKINDDDFYWNKTKNGFWKDFL